MIEALFEQIESAQTAAKVNVVSGLRQFVRALTSIEAVKSLATAARADETVAISVLKKLAGLSQIKVDPRYENPNDVAMGAYLQVLSRTTPELYTAAIGMVSSAQNCWWAEKLAETASRLNPESSQETLDASSLTDASVVGVSGAQHHVSTNFLSVSQHVEELEVMVPAGLVFVDTNLFFTLANVDYHGSSFTGNLEVLGNVEGLITCEMQAFGSGRVNTPTISEPMALAA